ncbi:Dihydrolipoamide acetyltransferase component of pyruvate dehydrogenase complex, partial [Schistosoma japonicum]
APAGSSSIKVGGLIAVLATPGENWKEVSASATSLSQQTTTSNTLKQLEKTPTFRETQSTRSSSMGPAVRLLLQSHELDGSQIPQTGPRGQLLKGDVLAYVTNNRIKPVVTNQEKSVKSTFTIQSSTLGAAFTDVALSNMRNDRSTCDRSHVVHTVMVGKIM